MEFALNPAFKESVLQEARKKLPKMASSLVTYIKTVKLSRGRRSQGDVLSEGQPPYAWSGGFRNRISQRWKDGDPNTMQVGELGKDAFIGSVLENGMNIKAKKSFMTIPRSDEAIRHLKGGGTARSFPKKLVMIPSRGRPNIYFLVESKRGGKQNAARSIIHFVLAKNVRIRPHPWLAPSLEENWQNMLNAFNAP